MMPALWDWLRQTEDYLAFVPERLVKPARAGVRVFGTDLELPTFEVLAMWHPRFEREPRHRWLRKIIVDALSAAEPEDQSRQVAS